MLRFETDKNAFGDLSFMKNLDSHEIGSNDLCANADFGDEPLIGDIPKEDQADAGAIIFSSDQSDSDFDYGMGPERENPEPSLSEIEGVQDGIFKGDPYQNPRADVSSDESTDYFSSVCAAVDIVRKSITCGSSAEDAIKKVKKSFNDKLSSKILKDVDFAKKASPFLRAEGIYGDVFIDPEQYSSCQNARREIVTMKINPRSIKMSSACDTCMQRNCNMCKVFARELVASSRLNERIKEALEEEAHKQASVNSKRVKQVLKSKVSSIKKLQSLKFGDTQDGQDSEDVEGPYLRESGSMPERARPLEETEEDNDSDFDLTSNIVAAVTKLIVQEGDWPQEKVSRLLTNVQNKTRKYVDHNQIISSVFNKLKTFSSEEWGAGNKSVIFPSEKTIVDDVQSVVLKQATLVKSNGGKLKIAVSNVDEDEIQRQADRFKYLPPVEPKDGPLSEFNPITQADGDLSAYKVESPYDSM